MSTYQYSASYQEEERRRAEEIARAPKTCPHCNTPINENVSRLSKIRAHCGADRCRQAISRRNRQEQKEKDRAATRERIYQYCAGQLPLDQRRAVMDMTNQLMNFNMDEGHQIAWGIVQVIEAQRCKHDRIQTLIDNAAAEKRRATKTADYAQEREEMYKRRISELEAEIEVYRTLENAIYSIADDQLRKQPDPEPQEEAAQEEPEDADHAHTLAILAQAGIRPFTGMSREELEARAAESEEPGGWLEGDEGEKEE